MLPNGKLKKKKTKSIFYWCRTIDIICKYKKKHFDVNETTEGRIIIDFGETKCVVFRISIFAQYKLFLWLFVIIIPSPSYPFERSV